MDYYEKKFIEDGARKLRDKAHSRHFDSILLVLGEDAYREEILSEKPSKWKL